jgi:hypothetical protein
MRATLTKLTFAGLAVLCLGTGGPPASAADGVDTDIGGTWHLRFQGNRGAVLLHFPGAPVFGMFAVQGAGYSTDFQTDFVVSEDALQTLSFESDRNIVGTVALQDVARTTTVGELVVTRGRLNSPKERVVLRGVLRMFEPAAEGDEGDGEVQVRERKVRLVGTRLAEPEVELQGRTFDGRVRGSRVRSRKYDIQLYDEDKSFAPPLGEGYPFFVLQAGGPVRVDGT